jgi:hypothetical protein
VPHTVNAMGKVAHLGSAVSSLPTRLPTNIISVIIDAASALLSANTQTLVKPFNE